MITKKDSTSSLPATTAPDAGAVQQEDRSLSGRGTGEEPTAAQVTDSLWDFDEWLSAPITRFSLNAMERHSKLLGMTGQLLDRAYVALGAIETCAHLVRKSQIARDGARCAFTHA